ncbi:MAG: DUF2442 domain-containing protein [Acidobacteriota bacterium]
MQGLSGHHTCSSGFGNGEGKIYNCGPLLSRPEFRLLAVPAFFRAVRVDAGGYGISWNDDIDLSEYELWTNGEPVAGAEERPTIAGGGTNTGRSP